jgi:hypothetical protein
MFELLQIITVIIVAIAMALSLAHALELPGKLRLDRDTYLVVQSIYYPGVTIGGRQRADCHSCNACAPDCDANYNNGVLAHAGCADCARTDALDLLACDAAGEQACQRKAASARFFSVDLKHGSGTVVPDWFALRDRWEYSHVARAALAGAAFILLLVALVL